MYRGIYTGELWPIINQEPFGSPMASEEVVQDTLHLLTGQEVSTSMAKHSLVMSVGLAVKIGPQQDELPVGSDTNLSYSRY